MYVRTLLLLIVLIKIHIVPLFCWEIDLISIGTDICDVEKNKQSYDTFKTATPECLSQYEEKVNFDHAHVPGRNLFAYLTTFATEYFEEKINQIRLQAPLVVDSGLEGFYKVLLKKETGVILDFFYIHLAREKTGLFCFNIIDNFCNIGYRVKIISGKFRRWEDSSKCDPKNNPIEWDGNIMESARMYIVYRELKSRAITKTTLNAICPALKDRSDL